MADKVMVPPLVLVAAAAGAQHVIAMRAGRLRAWNAATAGALGGASIGFIASSVREFRRSQTTVNPMSPEQASSLVTGGPHRISRNPMYVGMAGVLSAHAIARGSWAAALPVIGFVTVIDRVQVRAEEAALTDQFGPAYTAYAARVPRWLKVPPSTRD